MSIQKIRTGGVRAFFVYDHTVLQREDDDLMDAVLYFYPPYVDVEEQCTVCGQLMGMSEFLLYTVSKSAPVIFKLQREKYCLKRVGNYSFVLEGTLQDNDVVLKRQLEHIYSGFVLVCGSIDNIKEQFVDTHSGFLAEMKGIWDILFPSVCPPGSQIDRVFHLLPSVELPKSNADLFLQASNMLQSSQRRPGVIVGAVLYKNKVLCTQMSPELTRKLVLVRPELPCIHIKTEFPLPGGIRLVTIFLTAEEYSAIQPLVQSENLSQAQYRHSKVSKFVWVNGHRESEVKISESPKRFTKDDSVHWRPSSRAEQTLNQLMVPKQTGRLSDIPIIECEENKSDDVSFSGKNEENKHSVTVSGEANESISDLDGDESDHDSQQTSNQPLKESLNIKHLIGIKVTDHQNPESLDTHDKNEESNCYIVTEALVHMHPAEVEKSNSVENENADSEDKRSEDLNDKEDYNTVKSIDKPEQNVDNLADKIKISNTSTIPNCDNAGSLDNVVTGCQDEHIDEGPIISDGLELFNNKMSENVTDECSNNQKLKNSYVQNDGVLPSNTRSENIENAQNFRKRINTDVSITVSDTEDNLSDLATDQSHLSGEETDATCQSLITSPGLHDNQDSLVFKYQSDTPGLSGEESVSEISPKIEKIPCITISRNNSMETAHNSMETAHNSMEAAHSSMESQKSASTVVPESGQSSLLWSPEVEALHDVTLYIQGHSDTCLMLLLDKDSVTDENVLQAIFKSALPHMAELDYYVKDSTQQTQDESFLDSYSFLRYDSFFQTMTGNSDSLLTSRDEEFQRLAGEMHTMFEELPNSNEMIFKSHLGSCYGNRTVNDETFFSAHTNSVVPTDRFPLSKDPVFSMDLTARQKLESTQNINLF